MQWELSPPEICQHFSPINRIWLSLSQKWRSSLPLHPRLLSVLTLLHSLFCHSFNFIPHYYFYFTSPLSINAVSESFKVNLSSSILGHRENCLEVITSTHWVLSQLNNNVWPRCGVCPMFRCEWMWEEQRRLCRGVCEHQRLQALWMWAGPCAGPGQTQLQRCINVLMSIWHTR